MNNYCIKKRKDRKKEKKRKERNKERIKNTAQVKANYEIPTASSVIAKEGIEVA